MVKYLKRAEENDTEKDIVSILKEAQQFSV